MLRVIRLSQPEWVLAENVSGLLTMQGGLVFEQICTDLEASGYEVQPFVIPAVAVNAPHRRDRIWFVANAIDRGQGRTERGSDGASQGISQEHRQEHGTAGESERTTGNRNAARYAPDTEHERCGERQQQGRPRPEERIFESSTEWHKDWMEVAAEFCSVDDGLPAELDGFELSKSKHRKEQLKAYGNAIVPQVAVEIMQGMKEQEG